MARRHLVAGGLLAMVVVSSGCTSTQQPAAPVDDRPSALSRGDTPLSAWRYDTAQTVGRLLVKDGGVVSVLQPSQGRRPSVEYTAALAVRSERSYDLALPPLRDGMFDADDNDPVFVSWLAVRYAGARPGFPAAQVRAGLSKRLQSLAEPVRRGEVEQSATYLLARQTLTMLGSRAPQVPAVNYCARLGAARDLITGSVWMRLAAAQGTKCSAAATARVADLAAERMDNRDGQVGTQTASELRAAATVFQLTGRPVRVPVICPAVLGEETTYGVRVSREPGAYLACADAAAAAGQRPELSGDVVSWLDLLVRTGGRLPEQQRIDSMGLLFETQTLQLLQFRPDLLAAARAAEVSVDPKDPEQQLTASFARGEVPRGQRAGVTGAVAMLAAAAALAGSDCPAADWFTAAVAAIPDRADIDEQFRRAVLVKAGQQCGVPGLDRQTAAPLAKARSVEAAAGPTSHLLDVWKAAEVRCLLEGRSGLTPATVRGMLPDYAVTNPKFDLSLDSLYASVRLSMIADGNCSGAFWDR